MRSLNPEEAELWARVAATIRPLSREPVALDEPSAKPLAKPSPKPAPLKQAPPVIAPKASPVANRTLDGGWDKRLRSGDVRPDRVVDLHGLDLDGAWWEIDGQLESAISAGERVVLLITGHRRAGDPPVERGRIRAAVHDWLDASRHAGRIAAVRGANRRHGGGGALYLILRR